MYGGGKGSLSGFNFQEIVIISSGGGACYNDNQWWLVGGAGLGKLIIKYYYCQAGLTIHVTNYQ